jgi:hypothetical protein
MGGSPPPVNGICQTNYELDGSSVSTTVRHSILLETLLFLFGFSEVEAG